MKTFFISLICLCVGASVTFAQFSANPYAIIYDDIEIWLNQGYISYLPNFRPLPEVTLAGAMLQVMEKGDNESARKAKGYLKKINNFGFRTSYSFFGRINGIGGDEEEKSRVFGNGIFQASGSSRINDLVSISAAAAGIAIADSDEETYKEMRNTYYLNKYYNKLEELERIRAGSFSNITAYGTFSSRTSFSLGKENLFLHTGFMRRSIGPFFEDGILSSPQAPQSPNLFVYWGSERIAATWGLYSLSSSQEYITFDFDKETGEATTEESTRNRLDKFFLYNAVTLRPSSQIEISLFEAIVFGRLNLGYILPIKVIYSTDSLTDFAAGNLVTGASMVYKPISTISIPITFFVDDISVSEYVKFNFYSKLKAAAEAGVEWTPKKSFVKKVKFGYQIVTPYTYTHAPAETNELYSTAYNTENFTHHGQHFATSLDPSSHRIYINTDFFLNKYATLGSILRVEQHNNASEGILKGPLNDGSILDDGYRSVYDDDNGSENATFQKRIDFLVGTIETTWETGLNYGFHAPVARRINVFGNINYSYRHITNYLLSSDVRTESIFQMDVGIEITHNFDRR